MKETKKINKKRIILLSIIYAMLCIHTVFSTAYIWKEEAKAEEIQSFEYAIFSPTVWNVYDKSTQKKETKGIQGTITITFNNFNAQLWYKEKTNEITNFKYVGIQKANITNEQQDENNEQLFHFIAKDNLSNAYIHIYIQQKQNSITENGILRTKTNKLKAAPTTYEYSCNLCACYLDDDTKIVLLVTDDKQVYTSRPDQGLFLPRLNNVSKPYLFNHTTIQSTNIKEAYENGLKDGTKDKNAYGIQKYNEGYAKGINDTNKYSFDNLIFSVIDAPIQTLYGLLNFDLLGVNILNLFLALITTSIMIFILKKVL